MKLINLVFLGMLFLVACNESQEIPVKKADCETVIQKNIQQSKNNHERAIQKGTYPMPYYVSVKNVTMMEATETHLICTADTIMSDGKQRKVRYHGTLRNGKWSYRAQYGSSN